MQKVAVGEWQSKIAREKWMTAKMNGLVCWA